MPIEPVASPRISINKLKFGVGVIWVAAAIAGGIGIGLIIRDVTTLTFTSEAPYPVAEASVSVTAAASIASAAGNILSVSQVPFRDIGMARAITITQAQAGNTFVTTSVINAQGAAASDALRPGFSHFGHFQGNIGAPAVE